MKYYRYIFSVVVCDSESWLCDGNGKTRLAFLPKAHRREKVSYIVKEGTVLNMERTKLYARYDIIMYQFAVDYVW